MFAQLTNADTNGPVLVMFGTGGVIKAERFDEDRTTELYNSEGNMIAKVKEDIPELLMKGVNQ